MAAGVRPNVLETVTAIYETAKCSFPDAKVSIIKVCGAVATVNLELSTKFSLTLEKAVASQEFASFLETCKNKLAVCKFEKTSDVFSVDVPSFFLLKKPLAGWQKFSREQYEEGGHSCAEALTGYLIDPDGKDKRSCLSFLGLLPELVEREDLKKEDLTYFKESITQIGNLEIDKKAAAIKNYRLNYPHIWAHLLEQPIVREYREYADELPDDYKDLVNRLKARVIGQDHATEKLARTLVAQKTHDKNSVFLFVGPSGVGKTELAKVVAGMKSNRFVDIRMNEFQNELDAVAFFGPRAAYIGAEDKPYFAKAFAPYATHLSSTHDKESYEVKDVVILFDEFEKAHTTIKQSLLSLFDEGQYEIQYIDSAQTLESKNVTCRYKFKSCIVINTSNLFQQEVLDQYLQDKDIATIGEKFCQWNNTTTLPTKLSPELLNRTIVVPFGPIPKGEPFRTLINFKLTEFITALKPNICCKKIIVENKAPTLKLLERKLYKGGVNNRSVLNYFKEVEEFIAIHKREWGDIKTVKIILYSDKNRLSLRIEKYNKMLGIYLPDPLKREYELAN